ncbi:hypothetical protein FC682_22825 [Peribacillus simplex]|uniref:Uncharacterized protein n=1 Tax=Peribacillus simplex TaxID=1478 RepID=A0A9X8ZJH3_9BACI|nr:hypothetical protein [Peribacillus simplex]TKH01748.1 hypothetical protein FC682_22825 [Peribacillus simplex]TKH13573.1 hypothetical protein FC678_06960 [Peribacillus simplex]
MEKVWGTFFNAGVKSDKTTDKLGLEKSFGMRYYLEGRHLIKTVTDSYYINNNPVEQFKERE